MTRCHTISRRFDRAAATYDGASALQRHAALQLAERIHRLPLPPAPRVLELGCGTGHLTAQLSHRIAGADFLATDIAPAMIAACRQRLPGVRHAVMDAGRPAVCAGFDLICANLAAQWFHDLPATLVRLAALLAPGGWLALSMVGTQTFKEWRAAHAACGLTAGTPEFPSAAQFGAGFPAGGELMLDEEHRTDHPATALTFLRDLRAIGADTPAARHRPLAAGAMRGVLRQLGDTPCVSYHLIYALWCNAALAPANSPQRPTQERISHHD